MVSSVFRDVCIYHALVDFGIQPTPLDSESTVENICTVRSFEAKSVSGNLKYLQSL